MDIAYAARDITPPPGEELAGYGFYINRRAEGTLDPLFVRACAFRQGADTALIVQFDLLALQEDVVAELRRRIGQAHNVRPERILLHCTHTHTGASSCTVHGPGTLTVWWRSMIIKHGLLAVEAAMKSWQAVDHAVWFDEEAEPIAFNRDDPDGPVDAHVRGLFVKPRGGAPVALVNLCCHPVVLGRVNVYSADYPGAVSRALAAKGWRCLFLTGPCGDLDPLVNRAEWGSGGPEHLTAYGRIIADAVASGVAKGARFSPDGVDGASKRIGLPVQAPSREACRRNLDEAQAALAQDPANGLALAAVQGTHHWLAMLDAERVTQEHLIEVQALRVGDALIAGVGAELFAELGDRIRERSGAARLLLAGTSNASHCYIATQRSIEHNSYAAQSARFYGVFPQQAGGGEAFADNAARFLGAAFTPPDESP